MDWTVILMWHSNGGFLFFKVVQNIHTSWGMIEH